MKTLSRRGFLHCSLCASGAWLLGCDSDGARGGADTRGGDTGSGDALPGDTAADAVEDSASDVHETVAPDAGPSCDDAFAGGTFVGLVPFAGEDTQLNQRLGQGWDGRLYTDLQVVPETPLIPNETFYLRTFTPDRLDASGTWAVAVDGLVDAPSSLTLAEMMPNGPQDMGVHVLECSGNGRRGGFGLMSAASWGGVLVSDVLDRLAIDPSATRVRISGFDDHSAPSVGGHSTPGASWIFTFDQLAEAGAFFATQMNGQPLPADHGSPVRLYVPGWYGCSCIKWVNALTLVDDDAPATSQMREFASRTHQVGVPSMARDYRPASMDQAAMPVRIERWEVDGAPLYRVMGILWGGQTPVAGITLHDGDQSVPVEVCPVQTQNALWTVWQHAWRPRTTGRFGLTLTVDDASVPTRRLDRGYYERFVDITAA